MENASKALLIAASILIVILLIAFGMQVLNSTQGTKESVEGTMDATEKATYNSKFTMYFGSNKSAAQAKALAQVVVAHNATNEEAKEITLCIIKNGTSYEYTDPEDITNNVSEITGSVEIKVADGGTTNGLIKKINIITNP